jgi:hypothetical protein
MDQIDIKIKSFEWRILSIDKRIESIDWSVEGSREENKLTGEKIDISENITRLKLWKKFLPRITKLGIYKTFILQKNIGPPDTVTSKYKTMDVNAKICVWIAYWCNDDLIRYQILLSLDKEKIIYL